MTPLKENMNLQKNSDPTSVLTKITWSAKMMTPDEFIIN